MPYKDAKIYCDGSHYIAIPKTTRPKRPKKPEKKLAKSNQIVLDKSISLSKQQIINRITLKEEFESKFKETLGKGKAQLKRELIEYFKPYFKTESDAIDFININLQRKAINAIARRVR